MSKEEIIRLANVLTSELQNCDDGFADEVLYAINNAELMEEW